MSTAYIKVMSFGLLQYAKSGLKVHVLHKFVSTLFGFSSSFLLKVIMLLTPYDQSLFDLLTCHDMNRLLYGNIIHAKAFSMCWYMVRNHLKFWHVYLISSYYNALRIHMLIIIIIITNSYMYSQIDYRFCCFLFNCSKSMEFYIGCQINSALVFDLGILY